MSFNKSCSEDTPNSPIIQKISARLIPGTLTTHNKGAIDWGWQSFLAYGCNNHVIIVNTKHVKVYQTLEKHKTDIVKVKWGRENYYHDLSTPYTLRLASADLSGNVVVWDVPQASSTCILNEGSKPIAEMEWITGTDSSHPFLLTLHPPGSIVLWNTETGSKVWKKTYNETLQSFSIDPFSPNNIAFLASDCIVFMDDFNLTKVPPSSGRKFYISNPSSVSSSGSMFGLNSITSGSQPASSNNSNNNVNEEKGKTGHRSQLARRMRVLIGGEFKNSVEERVALNECLQLSYHQSYRHHLLLLYPKEILVLDLEINQTVGIVGIERNGFPLVQLYSCQQRDVLICLHEPGSVSLRLRQRGYQGLPLTPSEDAASVSSLSLDSLLEVSYETQCQSEPLRHTKHSRVVGMTVCPSTECQVALMMNDGRILVLDLINHQQNASLGNENSKITHLDSVWNKNFDELTSDKFTSASTLGHSRVVPFPCSTQDPKLTLADRIPTPLYDRDELSSESVPTSPPATSVSYYNQHRKKSLGLQFLLVGYLNGLTPSPHVIRMCPPVTFRNWSVYKPLMAVGSGGGILQIVNMATGAIESEFSIHTAPIRGIEWISLQALLSFAHPNIQNVSSGLVKNELVVTDVQSGRTRTLRIEQNEESPINMVRVSCQRQYFIVAFRDQPFELWDLNNLTLVRTMPKTFVSITALEWSPLHTKRAFAHQDSNDEMSSGTLSGDQPENDKMSKLRLTPTKEHFVFTDTDGQLLHFSVEGNVVRDGSRIPSDSSMGMITCIAWKMDHIILGDVDGNLNFWNLKNKNCRNIPLHRGCIKKIRFAPGRGNMKIFVLYNDGADIWDAKEAQVLSQVRVPKDLPKIQDMDWAGSERPILCTSDGCLRICDVNLKTWTSPLSEYYLSDVPFSPHILSIKGAFNLKSLLQYQPVGGSQTPGTPGFTSSGTDLSDFDVISQNSEINSPVNITGFVDDDLAIVQNQLQNLDQDIKHYLSRCPFGTAERCLLISRLFGDEESAKFWTVALHYLKRHIYLMAKDSEKSTPLNENDCNDSDSIRPDRVWAEPFLDPPLDTGYDILMENQTYQRLQLDRTYLHDFKRSTYAQTQRCIENLLLLRQWDRAVQLLLETESNGEGFYSDCLRACLVATVKSSNPSQSVIKLVATNLIAGGRISEGVQLLSLIEKGADACRYLQGATMWDKALWLAKSTLDQNECLEVLRRWVDHLSSSSVNQKNKALLVLLSQGQFWKVLTCLHNWGYVERATLFLLACQEFGVILKTEPNAEIEKSILLNYIRYLCSVGNYQGALRFCELVGSAAEELKQEIQEFCESA